jgi:hypothetical protein
VNIVNKIGELNVFKLALIKLLYKVPMLIIYATHLAGLWYSHKNSKRASGTGTLFSFGSMVQKGKFSAGAADFVRTLKKVD